MALTLDNVKELIKMLFPNIKMLNKITESDGKPLYNGEPFSTELDLLETEHNDTAFIGGKLYTPTIHDTASVTDERIKYWATGKGEEGIELDLLKSFSSQYSNILYSGTKTLGGYTYPYISVTPNSSYRNPIGDDRLYYSYINEAKFLLPKVFDDYEAIFYMTEVNNLLSTMPNYSILGNGIILAWTDEACIFLLLNLYKDRSGQCLLKLGLEIRFKRYDTMTSAEYFILSLTSDTAEYKNMGLKGVRAIVKKNGNSINVKIETRPNGGEFTFLDETTWDLYKEFSYDSNLAEKYKDKLIPVQIGVVPIGTTTSYIGIQDFNAYPSVEVETHNLNVKVSSTEDNSLILKEDGLYVPPVGDDVAISKETGNQIVEKSDGLFVPAPEIPDAVTISQETGNQITKKTDGLYVPSYKDSQTITQDLTESVSLDIVMNSFLNGTTNTSITSSASGGWDASSFLYPEYSFMITGIKSGYADVMSTLTFSTEYEFTFDFILDSGSFHNVTPLRTDHYVVSIGMKQGSNNPALTLTIQEIIDGIVGDAQQIATSTISLAHSRLYRMVVTRKGSNFTANMGGYVVTGDISNYEFVQDKGLGISPIDFSTSSTMLIGLVELTDSTLIVYDNKMHVKVSAQTENQLQIVDDGLYVPAADNSISVSQEEGNQIIEKADGIYVSSTEVALSAFADNRILKVDDGLYVQGFTDSPTVEFNGEPGYGIDPQILIDDFKKYNNNSNFKESFYGESETLKALGIKGFKVSPSSTSDTYKDPYQVYSILELGSKYEIEILYPINTQIHFTFAWIPSNDTYFGLNYSIYIPGQHIYFGYANYLIRPDLATDLYWVALSDQVHNLYSKAAYRTLNVKRDGYSYIFTLTYYDVNLKKLGSEGVIFDISMHTASDKNKVFASDDVKVRVAMECRRDIDFGITKFYAPNLGDISAGNYAHVKVSPDPDNAIKVRENGLYAPQMNLLCAGEGVEGYFSETSLTIDTKIDPSGNNDLMTRGYGLYVPKVQESTTVSSTIKTVEGTAYVDLNPNDIAAELQNNAVQIGKGSYTGSSIHSGYLNVVNINPLYKYTLTPLGAGYLTETFRCTKAKYKNYKAIFSCNTTVSFTNTVSIRPKEMFNIILGLTDYYRVCLSISRDESSVKRVQIVVTNHIKNSDVFLECQSDVIYEEVLVNNTIIDDYLFFVEKRNSFYNVKYFVNNSLHEGTGYVKDSTIIMSSDKGLSDVSIGLGAHKPDSSSSTLGCAQYFRINSFAVEQGNGEEFVYDLDVKVSSDEGNALETHGDGLYVPGSQSGSVEISAKANNLITQESDGLYAAGFVESQTVTFKTNLSGISNFLDGMKSNPIQAPSLTEDNLSTSDYLQSIGVDGFRITRSITNENWVFMSKDKLGSKSKIHVHCLDGICIYFALYDNNYLFALYKVPGYSHAWFGCSKYENGTFTFVKNLYTVELGVVNPTSMEFIIDRNGEAFNFTSILHSGLTSVTSAFGFNPMTACPEVMGGMTGQEGILTGFCIQDTTDMFYGIKVLEGAESLDLMNGTAAQVKLSAESNNALEVKDDGLYVPAVEIPDVTVSAKANNLITKETDGLYAPAYEDSPTIDFKDKSAEIKLSTELNNALQVKDDGLYAPVVKSNVTTTSPFQNTTMVSYWEETNPTPDVLLNDLYKHPGYMYGNSDDLPDVTMMSKGAVFSECPCLKIGDGSNVQSGYLFGDYEIRFRIKADKDDKEWKDFYFSFIYAHKKIDLKLYLSFNVGSDKSFVGNISPTLYDEQGSIGGGVNGIRVDNSNDFVDLDLSVTPLDIVASKKKGVYTAQVFQQGIEKFKMIVDIDEITRTNGRNVNYGTLSEQPHSIRIQCGSSLNHYTYVGITSFECEGSRLNVNLSKQKDNALRVLSDGLHAPFLGKFPIDTDTITSETWSDVLRTEVKVSPKKNNFLLRDRSSGLFVPAINDNKVIKTSLTKDITKTPIDIPAFVTDLVNNGIKSYDSMIVSQGNNPNSFVCGSSHNGWDIRTAISSFGNYRIQMRLECPEENFWILKFFPFITDDYEISIRVVKNGQFLIDYHELTVYTYSRWTSIHNSQDSDLFKDGLFTDLVVERIGTYLHIEIKRDDTILKEMDLSVATIPVFSKTDKGLGKQRFGFGIETQNSYIGGGFQIKELSEITDDTVNYDIDIKTSAQGDNQIQILDDGLYVPKPDITVPISEEVNNQIQKKDDGLFVEPTVIKASAQEGNALSVVDDGLFTPDLKPKLDEHDYLIKANKVVNEELDWITFAINSGENIYAFKFPYNYNLLEKFSVLDTSGTENALSMFADNKIKVKAGKTYELSALICLKPSLNPYNIRWIWRHIDENGIKQDLGSSGDATDQSDLYTDIAYAFYKCEHDTELTLEVFWDGLESANMQYRILMAKIFVKEIKSVTVDPVNYVNKESGIEDTPVGHILTYMGLKAPKHYLICDGREVNISDYPYLAKQFLDEFGTMNYFGGDGTTTFCLPDLRNQFLRGYHGEAAETLSTDVGVKQEPTELPYVYAWSDKTQGVICSTLSSDNGPNTPLKTDTINYRSSNLGLTPNSAKLGVTGTQFTYTTRPVNVTVLYCIKYEPTYFMDFSTKTQGVVKVYNQETVLWQNESRTAVPINGTIWTLSESYKTFDSIYIEIVSKDEAECNLVAPMTIPVSSMKDNMSLTFFNPFNYQDNNTGYTVGTRCHLRFVNDITVVMESNTNKAVDDEMTLIPWKIVGIKLIAEQP